MAYESTKPDDYYDDQGEVMLPPPPAEMPDYPVENMRFKWTRQLEYDFFNALSKTGSVSAATRKIGCSPGVPYNRKEKDEQFAQNWENARLIAADHLEEAARARAVDGVDEAVYYLGKIVGYKKNYSDGLLTTLLKANNPTKFRDNKSVEHSGDIGVKTIFLHDDRGGSPFPPPLDVNKESKKKDDDE